MFPSPRSAALPLLAAALAPVAPLRAQPPAAPAPSVAAPTLSDDLAPLPDLGVAWPDLAAPETPLTPGAASAAAPPPPADQTRRYQVQLVGADELGSAFRTRFNSLSALVTNEGKAANAAQIDRRARDDEELMRTLLRAAGRYEGRVVAEVRTESEAITVALTVEPGPLYTFSSVALPGLDAAGADAARLAKAFTVKPGDPVDADAVTAAVAGFRATLGNTGYPFATVGEPQVAIDYGDDQTSLTLTVTPGAPAQFGRITTTGPNPIFSQEHLERLARFRPGQRYDAARVDDFRRALIQTGLVSAVTLTPVRTADAGVVDVAVRIDRAPPRTIAGQLGYGTGEGIRAEVSWQHRNLIKPEGAVTFRGIAGTREQLLGANLRRSNFRERDQVLTAQVTAAHRDFDAFDARTFTIGAGIERQTNIIWQKTWTWSVGAELVATDERDTNLVTGEARRRTFLLAALPSSLGYDGSDDLLNPTRGYRLAGRVSPELSLQNGAQAYLKLQLDGSTYLPFSDGKYVLAGRFRFGSIQGAPRDRIAPSRRFYAGGGGSVRGYGFQDIGPLDVDGDPVGGRALTEFSAEARIRFGTFGVVPFLDAGNLYAGSTPKLSGLRYGAGLGARYYSSFGPIRIDVGTPLGRRPGEPRVSVYVSLGQAF